MEGDFERYWLVKLINTFIEYNNNNPSIITYTFTFDHLVKAPIVNKKIVILIPDYQNN